jgi:hypothetical protein
MMGHRGSSQEAILDMERAAIQGLEVFNDNILRSITILLINLSSRICSYIKIDYKQ